MANKRHDDDDDLTAEDRPDRKPTPTPPIAVDPKPTPGPHPDQELPKPDRRSKPEPPPAETPVLPGYEQKEPLKPVTLQGGGPSDGDWRVGTDDKGAIPQTLAASGVTYDLSDRAAGVYNFRPK